MSRVGHFLHVILVALDQLAQVILFGIPWSMHLTSKPPSPYETISSRCGRMALKSHRWAIWAVWTIDHAAMLLGAPKGHCARSIVRADLLDYDF